VGYLAVDAQAEGSRNRILLGQDHHAIAVECRQETSGRRQWTCKIVAGKRLKQGGKGRMKIMTNKLDTEETGKLFPELDKENPEHKALLKLARDYDKKKKAHLEGIATLKEQRDNAEKRLLAKMHELKIDGFIYNGVKVNIEIGAEKAVIKVEEDAGDDEPADEPKS
jgi:hypothetical protein